MLMLIWVLLTILGVIVPWVILYFVVKHAVIAAHESTPKSLSAIAELLSVQANHAHQVAKHLAVQTELMLAQARQSGVRDEVLAPLVALLGRSHEASNGATELPFR